MYEESVKCCSNVFPDARLEYAWATQLRTSLELCLWKPDHSVTDEDVALTDLSPRGTPSAIALTLATLRHLPG